MVTAKFKTLLFSFVSVLFIDHAGKAWAVSHLEVGVVQPVIPWAGRFLTFTHARNPGGAFGLLVEWPWGWRLATFLAVAIMTMVAVAIFYRAMAPGERFNAAALGLILGGTVSNLMDRLTRGEVIDYLHLDFRSSWSWPDFNLADLGILVGVAALILELLSVEGASRARDKRRMKD